MECGVAGGGEADRFANTGTKEPLAGGTAGQGLVDAIRLRQPSDSGDGM
jgi:hypothetical protein